MICPLQHLLFYVSNCHWLLPFHLTCPYTTTHYSQNPTLQNSTFNLTPFHNPFSFTISLSLSQHFFHSLSLSTLAGNHHRHRRTTTVASSGHQSQSLTKRKSSISTSATASSSSSPSSKPTRIVYREKFPSESELPFWQKTWFILLLLIMAIAFFALAIFLFLSLDSDFNASTVFATSSSSSSSSSSEGVEVTYGSVVKLMHERTKFRLHSHDVPYGSGSGQQSVTGFPNVDDSNSYWVVKPVPGTSAKQGDTIQSGTVVRLQHMRTRKWLHSHLHASPISGNFEVSCFGGESDSDTGDYWKLEIEGKGKTWRQDQKVRLRHVDTGGYLHSHDKKYQRIAGGQQEVCGVKEKNRDNIWLAAEGVYLPSSDGKAESS